MYEQADAVSAMFEQTNTESVLCLETDIDYAYVWTSWYIYYKYINRRYRCVLSVWASGYR